MIEIIDKREQERRADWHTPADCEKLLGVEERLQVGTARMDRIESSIGSLMIGLERNTKDTGEILEIIKMGKTFFKMAGWFGTAVKWLAPVVVSLLAIYHSITPGTHK